LQIVNQPVEAPPALPRLTLKVVEGVSSPTLRKRTQHESLQDAERPISLEWLEEVQEESFGPESPVGIIRETDIGSPPSKLASSIVASVNVAEIVQSIDSKTKESGLGDKIVGGGSDKVREAIFFLVPMVVNMH